MSRGTLSEGDLGRGWKVSMRWQCYFESLTDVWTDGVTDGRRTKWCVSFGLRLCRIIAKDNFLHNSILEYIIIMVGGANIYSSSVLDDCG
jgi:hypothetical protein